MTLSPIGEIDFTTLDKNEPSEFEEKIKKAQTTSPNKINLEKVKKNWDDANADFYRSYLILMLSWYESIKSIKEGRVQNPPSFTNDIIVRIMKGSLEQMQISNEYAKRRNRWENIVCCKKDNGFWLQCSLIALEIGISGTVIGLLFENAIYEINKIFFREVFFQNTTSIAPQSESTLTNIAPIIRVCMNILSIGFSRIKDKIEKNLAKKDHQLGMLVSILGSRDEKEGDTKFESDTKIEVFLAKLKLVQILKNDLKINSLKKHKRLSDLEIEERIRKILDRLNYSSIKYKAVEKDSLAKDDVLSVDTTDKEVANLPKIAKRIKCAKLFRQSHKCKSTSFKKLLMIKNCLNGSRDTLAKAFSSGVGKIELYHKSQEIELDLVDELIVIETKSKELKEIFKWLRNVPTQKYSKVKEIVKIEKGIKLSLDVLALFIVVYDQYTEMVGDPILWVVVSAFFLHFIGFILARTSECVNEGRKKQVAFKNEVKALLKFEEIYTSEINETRDLFQKNMNLSPQTSRKSSCERRNSVSEGSATTDFDINNYFKKKENKQKLAVLTIKNWRANKQALQACRVSSYLFDSSSDDPEPFIDDKQMQEPFFGKNLEESKDEEKKYEDIL